MMVQFLTKLHSVPSMFQFVTLADTLRNIGSACRATTSAASRKLLHLPCFDLAKNSSTSRTPML
jgi:hypothetical protein